MDKQNSFRTSQFENNSHEENPTYNRHEENLLHESRRHNEPPNPYYEENPSRRYYYQDDYRYHQTQYPHRTRPYHEEYRQYREEYRPSYYQYREEYRPSYYQYPEEHRPPNYQYRSPYDGDRPTYNEGHRYENKTSQYELSKVPSGDKTTSSKVDQELETATRKSDEATVESTEEVLLTSMTSGELAKIGQSSQPLSQQSMEDVIFEQSLLKIEEIVAHDSTKREVIAERLGMITVESYEKQYNVLTRRRSSSSVYGESYHNFPEQISSSTSIRKPCNSVEQELIENGLLLPLQYLENDHYPRSLTPRPVHIVPKELISNNETFNQEKLVQLLSDGIYPKWIKEFILSELKPLFLRTRHLDNSKRNRIIQDFLSALFPSLEKNNHERLVVLAADFRKSWSNWRNVLWQKINSRYKKYSKKCKKDSSNESENISSYLQPHHVSEIFETWQKYVSGRLSEDDEKMLKGLVIFGFHCLIKHSDNAHCEFFSSTGNLYTVNCNFPSAYSTATSMDLSQYEITLEIRSPDNSDSDEEKPKAKKRLKK